MLNEADVPKAKPKDYFKTEKLLLKLNGISLRGNTSIAFKIYSVTVLMIFKFVYPFVACGDIFKQEFNEAARVFLYVVSTYVAGIITFATFRNRANLGQLLDRLEEAPFLANSERGGNGEERLLEEWVAFNSAQRLILYAASAAATVLGSGVSFLTRCTNDNYEKWTFPYGPLTVLDVTSSPNFEISWAYQNLCMYLVVITATSFSITLSGILSFISVQLQILQNSLRCIVEHTQQKFLQDEENHDVCEHLENKPSWEYLQRALRVTVSYHLEIFKIMDELEDIFSMSMLATYLGVLCILCFMLFVASLVSAKEIDFATIKLFGEAGAIIFLVLIMCYWGEQVSYESEKVGIAAYESDFVGTDIRFQKGLAIIIRRTQYPSRIKAGNIIENSLVTFAWLIRATYSCFMVLRKTNAS